MKVSLYVVLLCWMSLAASLSAADYVWIEGERPKTTPILKQVDGVEGVSPSNGFEFSGWGRTWIISDEQMLHVNLSSGDVDKFMPEEGLVFGYDFALDRGGKQNVWARIGYEWVRSDFQWRIDGGPWQTCSRRTPTTNVQPLQTWNELAWIQLGAGRLEGRQASLRDTTCTLTRRPDSRGDERTARILHMLDAVCITPNVFRRTASGNRMTSIRMKPTGRPRSTCSPLVPATSSAERVETVLDGWWTTAAWDENDVTDESRLQPTTKLPDLDSLAWYGYQVPNDRDDVRPEMSFSHRYLVRTRLNVPASLRRPWFLS